MKNGEDHMIRDLRSGQERAYERLFRDYYRPLSVFASKYVSNLEIAREIVQNLFVHIYENRSSLIITTSLESYLYQSVRNRCLNQIKQWKTQKEHLEKYKSELDGTEDLEAGIRDFIQEEFLAIFSGQAFDYEFVDEFHKQMYQEEKKMSRIILYVAILANLIAALGIYGLIAYSRSLRTREVGLRKVLGANFATISKLFSREFIILVVLANLASWPVVYFVTWQWLQSFPYKVAPSVVPYLAAMPVTMIIAYGSMLYHTYKASQINPAQSLRHE